MFCTDYARLRSENRDDRKRMYLPAAVARVHALAEYDRLCMFFGSFAALLCRQIAHLHNEQQQNAHIVSRAHRLYAATNIDDGDCLQLARLLSHNPARSAHSANGAACTEDVIRTASQSRRAKRERARRHTHKIHTMYDTRDGIVGAIVWKPETVALGADAADVATELFTCVNELSYINYTMRHA